MDATQTLVSATHRYLEGSSTLRELARVAAAHIHLLPTLESEHLVRRLIGTLELSRAELADGIITEEGLRRDLQAALTNEPVPVVKDSLTGPSLVTVTP